MLTLALVVEGDFDAAALPEFIRKYLEEVEIITRLCNPRGGAS